MDGIKNIDATSPWYVIHTFNCCELKIADFLIQKGIPCFIPMEYRVKKREVGKLKKKLVPVIHNLLFVQKNMPEKKMKRIFAECSLPIYFQRKENSCEYYEIRHSEMQLFMLMCDPDNESRRFISLTEASLKVGSEVNVVYGIFKGFRGKLVRYHKQYYILNIMVGIGVMIKVSRWCCKPCE